MEIERILTHLGFDEKEAAVYLALLELGEASMTQLARTTGLKRSTAYMEVDRLQIKGLVAQTQKGKRTVYSAVHPRRLQDYIANRQKQFTDIFPQLLRLYNQPLTHPRVQVLDGESGVRLVYEQLYDALSHKHEALWFTNISMLQQQFPFAISRFREVIRDLPNCKIRELNYAEPAAYQWAEQSASLRGNFYHQRILKTPQPFGFTDNLIFQNTLVIFSLRDKPSVIMIESEDVANTYRALFEAAWQQGESFDNTPTK